MDINDLISGGGEYIRKNRPRHPDLDRISEIVLNMKAMSSEASSPEEHETNWRKHVESFVDFDSIAWQAMNVAFDVFGIRTNEDLMILKSNRQRFSYFIGSMQAFYDGFLLGAEFQKKGGHREC
jgi:hypothetical protein